MRVRLWSHILLNDVVKYEKWAYTYVWCSVCASGDKAKICLAFVFADDNNLWKIWILLRYRYNIPLRVCQIDSSGLPRIIQASQALLLSINVLVAIWHGSLLKLNMLHIQKMICCFMDDSLLATIRQFDRNEFCIIFHYIFILIYSDILEKLEKKNPHVF